MSPEADRQKATVQVKVQILEPDSFLRPEMNANVAFLAAGAARRRRSRAPGDHDSHVRPGERRQCFRC